MVNFLSVEDRIEMVTMSFQSDESKKDFDAKRNLIVNYLPPTFTQEDVKTLFTQIGTLANCKLMKKSNGESLGYAFIEYQTEHFASTAIQKIDGIKIDDKVIKVSYARQSSPEIKDSNVYVAGLPLWITENDLFSLFSPFGTVITHKLLTGPGNQSRGVGFVRFSLKCEAQNAIDSMAGKVLPDSATALTVKLAIPPASKSQSHQGTLLMSSVTGKSNFRFNPLAPNNSNQSGTYSSGLHHNAASTLRNASYSPLPSFNLPSNSINSALQSPQHFSEDVHSLYVYGLQPTHTELTLYEIFAPFGGIINVKIIRDASKDERPCKGYGFVNFKKYEDAHAAVSTMNGCPFEGKHLQVSFKNNFGSNPHLTAALSQLTNS